MREAGRWPTPSPSASACPRIHLIDDLVFSGQTLRSARQALGLAGLDATTASAILWTYRAEAALEELAVAGMTEITSLAHQPHARVGGGFPGWATLGNCHRVGQTRRLDCGYWPLREEPP
jgi:hypothetical protein